MLMSFILKYFLIMKLVSSLDPLSDMYKCGFIKEKAGILNSFLKISLNWFIVISSSFELLYVGIINTILFSILSKLNCLIKIHSTLIYLLKIHF